MNTGAKLIFYFSRNDPIIGDLIQEPQSPGDYWVIYDTFADKTVLIKNFDFIVIE